MTSSPDLLADVRGRVEGHRDGHGFVVRDDGAGIDPAKLERPATLRALRQRTEALDAELQVVTAPGEGTRLTLVVPMLARRSKPWIPARLTRRVPT